MKPELIEAHVDATAALIGLPIGAEHRAGVLRYFGIAASLAEAVMAQSLAPDDEPATVFVPIAGP